VPWGKLLDPEGVAAFVGTAVASDEFGRCASSSGHAAQLGPAVASKKALLALQVLPSAFWLEGMQKVGGRGGGGGFGAVVGVFSGYFAF
jgi:hypothetical protein